MKKRVKIISVITSLCICLSLFTMAVLSAQQVQFGVTSTLTFEATDVFVKAEGNLKQGSTPDDATVQTENIPTNANYTYVGYSYNRAGSGTDPDAPGGAPLNNFVNASGADAISWTIGDINFSSDLPVVVYDFKFTNYSSFDVQANITVTQGSGLQTLVTNGDVVVAGETNTVYMLARDDSSDSDTATFRVIVQLKDFTSSFTASDVTLNMNVSFKKFTPVESSEYTNLTFTTLSTTDKTVSVSKKGTPTGAIAIPPKVLVDGTEYTVTSIGDSAFSSCSSLTSISLPNGVTSIGNNAFFICSSLTSISLPSKVTSIGRDAFYNCSSLTSISLPNGVTGIGRSAFYLCSSLTSIEIPSGVTSIGSYTFYYCSSLTSIEIPSGVTSIGSYAFRGCGNLQITVEEGNTTYSSDNGSLYNKEQTELIRGAGGVSTVNILDKVTSIGDSAFDGCSSLTSIEIPSKVISIYSSAFSGCSSLTSIEIPSEVTSIGDYVFSGCSKLTSIDMSKITNWGSLSLGSSSFRTNASTSVPTTITVASGQLSAAKIKLTDSTIGLLMENKIKLTDGATTLTWNGSWA